MRLLDTSSTVTGMDSPSSVNTRVMPTLRPTRPSRNAAGEDVGFDIVFLQSRLRLAGANQKGEARILAQRMPEGPSAMPEPCRRPALATPKRATQNRPRPAPRKTRSNPPHLGY